MKPRRRKIKHPGDAILHNIAVKTDRVFAILLGVQFVAAVLGAVLLTPRTWDGAESSTHIHLWVSIAMGVLLTGFPTILILRNPGAVLNRYVVSVAQLMYSGLFIHLTGGRIETHFHIFGSFAFLAFYRDWKVLIPGTIVTAIDHFARGVYWPQSVFGVIAPAPWRALEHAGWVIFENVFLSYSCIRSRRLVCDYAEHQSDLERINGLIERLVEERTQELEAANEALSKEFEDRKKLESDLLEAQKLESIGQLAAGIAHEINTPAQYVGDNTRFLRSEFGGILQVIEEYAKQLDKNKERVDWDTRSSHVRNTLDSVDYEFLRTEIPAAISQSLEGIERITEIVKAMKEFSHPGTDQAEPADLNNAIRSTCMVCSNRWKYCADIEYDFDDNLGPVPCFLGAFNQVILNIVVNAADAIEANLDTSNTKGLIRIKTERLKDSAKITISDNAGGMSESVRQKIFDPFFTTKEVGKGTGQGLAISKDVIVNKHNGVLECESNLGVGTTFTIELPLHAFSVQEQSDQMSDQSEAA